MSEVEAEKRRLVLSAQGQTFGNLFNDIGKLEKLGASQDEMVEYLESKGGLTSEDIDDQLFKDEEKQVVSGNEIGLILFCIAFFALYVTVKVLFNDIELVSDNNNEL